MGSFSKDGQGAYLVHFVHYCQVKKCNIAITHPCVSSCNQDGDGKISTSEFEAVLGGEDYRLVPRDTVKQLIAQIDKDGDGQVSNELLSSFGTSCWCSPPILLMLVTLRIRC